MKKILCFIILFQIALSITIDLPPPRLLSSTNFGSDSIGSFRGLLAFIVASQCRFV